MTRKELNGYLSYNKMRRINEVFSRNHNLTRTARQLRHSTDTVRKHLSEDLLLKKRQYRKFNRDPLSYYVEKFDTYVGMCRYELQIFDPSLYRTLKIYDQLDIAVPKLDLIHRRRNENLQKKKKQPGFREVSDPLEYYNENYDRYKGMNRSQLAKEDNALYVALLRHGQIDLAIPEFDKAKSERGRRGGMSKHILSESEIEIIVDSHELFYENPNEAARYIPYSLYTIRRVWKSKGLETIGRGKWRKVAA